MVTKFFKEFSGNKAAFQAGGYETTFANNIVFIKDEANNGAGACIFTRGMYFADFQSLISALAFVKGINVGGTNYNAANGGGYLKFEAADPATVVFVENNGIKIGLAEAFVTAHNQVISDVVTIKADYLKASDKQELTQLVNDKDTAMKQYVDAEIAKVATSESFTALEGRVGALETQVGTIAGDYLKSSDKEELQGLIAEDRNRLTALEGDDTGMSARAIVQDEVAKQLQSENISESFDTLKEMAEYLSSHPEDVTGMNASIKQNADDIDAIEEQLKSLATSENLGALETRVKANEDAIAAVPAAIEAAEGRANSYADGKAKSEAEAAEGRINTKLEGYYTSEQTDSKIAAELQPYAKTADVNEALDAKANSADVYTKANADQLLGDKANVGDSYLKDEMDTKLSGKANTADVYTKAEVEAMFDAAFSWERIEA